MVVKAFSDIGRIFARRTVAINAGLVVDGKSRPCLLIPELWPCLHRASSAGHGMDHRIRQIPFDNWIVRNAGGDRECGTGHDDEGHDKTALIEATIVAQAKQTICLAG